MKYLKLLKKLRTFSNHHQHKMSCVIVKKNRIVSCGYNEVKTHPKSTASYNMLHAEISAVLGIDYTKTQGATAYVFREDRAGNMAMAKPCDGCHLALKLAGVKKIVYTSLTGWKEERV